MNGRVPSRRGNRDDAMAPHNCYPCAGRIVGKHRRGDRRGVAGTVRGDGEPGARPATRGSPTRQPSRNQEELDRGDRRVDRAQGTTTSPGSFRRPAWLRLRHSAARGSSATPPEGAWRIHPGGAPGSGKDWVVRPPGGSPPLRATPTGVTAPRRATTATCFRSFSDAGGGVEKLERTGLSIDRGSPPAAVSRRRAELRRRFRHSASLADRPSGIRLPG